MKKRNIKSKLSLNKNFISNLQSLKAKGGATAGVCNTTLDINCNTVRYCYETDGCSEAATCKTGWARCEPISTTVDSVTCVE